MTHTIHLTTKSPHASDGNADDTCTSLCGKALTFKRGDDKGSQFWLTPKEYGWYTDPEDTMDMADNCELCEACVATDEAVLLELAGTVL